MKSSVAILAALFASGAGAQAPVAAPPAGSDAPPVGQKLYAQHCLGCHQADGGGVPNLQPAITGGTWVKGDARALALFVMTGGFDSAARKEGASHNVMPAFRHLADEELAALLTYIRQRFGDGAPPVSAADIGAVRATLPATPPATS